MISIDAADMDAVRGGLAGYDRWKDNYGGVRYIPRGPNPGVFLNALPMRSSVRWGR